MSDLKLTTSHDLDLSGDDLQFTSGSEAVAQAVRTAVKTIRGEWFRDASIGVPWFTEVWGKGSSLGAVAALMRRAIENVPGVAKVASLDLDYNPNNRSVTITTQIVQVSDPDLVEFNTEFVL